MSSILFVVQSAPYIAAHSSDEAHDLIMASTAYGHSASVLFMREGVTQLVSTQTPPAGFKHCAKRIRGFEMFDVEPLFVSKHCLEQQDIELDSIIDGVNVLSSQQVEQLIREATLTLYL
ncbi:hypothetical protein DRW07_07915 [Alteromonas sediminis]|uniref:Uncharacterized protein n=1 Tax=Alteromonas sediminis TaxID=2259342 RepID=A0A3N5Y105_9ALTE|nr:DsrE family protein [Alteromonas sediminis]RPJ67437.1 hypothetical protein DRW07_07915 [Alteromonas sediminis]